MAMTMIMMTITIPMIMTLIRFLEDNGRKNLKSQLTLAIQSGLSAGKTDNVQGEEINILIDNDDNSFEFQSEELLSNPAAGIVLIFTVTQSTVMPHLITPDVGHSPVTGYAGCSDC